MGCPDAIPGVLYGPPGETVVLMRDAQPIGRAAERLGSDAAGALGRVVLLGEMREHDVPQPAGVDGAEQLCRLMVRQVPQAAADAQLQRRR
ncbi:hypothetical protein DF186_16315, partial [Enterococcus hirae]